jgi:SAM-dependent methyltransferase
MLNYREEVWWGSSGVANGVEPGTESTHGSLGRFMSGHHLRSLPAKMMMRLERLHRTDRIQYEGFPLPPRSLRIGGPEYQDDRFFVEYGEADARLLVDWFGLDETTQVIDVGCGQCRLAIGLMRQLGTIGRYVGLDLDAPSMDWGTRHLTALDPRFEFRLLDVQNERYNPGGPRLDDQFRFPFADDAFDLVHMGGVSPHLDADEHRIYLREFRRLLRPEGHLYMTSFVEDDVPSVTVNPEGYLGASWTGPRNCIRYERHFFFSLLEAAGLHINRFEHGTAMFGMSRVAATVPG